MSGTTTAYVSANAVADEAVRPGAWVPDVFPFARQPVWFMVAGRPLKERAVLEFLIAHINEQTGRLTAFPGIKTIAEAVGLETRAVRCAIDGLIEFGAVEEVPTYLDRETGERTFDLTTGGKSNAQTSNTYTPCLAPPGGMLYPGPINLAEWYDQRRQTDPRRGRYQGLIEKRIQEARTRQVRGRSTRPPQNPSSGGGAFLIPPPRYPARTGGGVSEMHPEEDQVNPDQEESVRPFRHVRTRAHACARDGHGSEAGAAAVGPGQRTDGRTEDSPEDGIGSSFSKRPPAPIPASLSGEQPVPGPFTPEEGSERSGVLSAPRHGQDSGSGADAQRLLSEPRVQAGLARLDCRTRQRVQLVELVADALDQGHNTDRVRGYVLSKCRETTSRRMSYLLGAFAPEHIGDLADTTPVPGPETQAAEATERRMERETARQRREAPPAPVRVSPVDWVPDLQFAALSPGDRSILTVTAGRPEDQLTTFDRQRLHRIRDHLDTETCVLQPV